jgi:hypothetical protein
VEVADKTDWPFVLGLFDESLGCVNSRVLFFIGVYPLAVEVDPQQVRAVVALNYAVGVEHRNNLENEVLAESGRDGGLA